MKKAFICAADGFEEVETVTPLDYLRRAGVQTMLIGLEKKTVCSSRNVTLCCDAVLKDIAPYPELADMVILPGGMPNSRILGESQELRTFVEKVYAAGGIIATICAAPVFTLGAWGLLEGKQFTCYPGMGEELTTRPDHRLRVVRDGNIITAAAAGVAEEFALTLVEVLCGAAQCNAVKSAILAR